MKILKLSIFSLLTIFAISIFLTSCEQEQLITEQVEAEQGFRVSAKYQKKITVTDGLNSVVLGISSDNKEAFDLHTENAYALNSLTTEELSKLETEIAVEMEGMSEKKSDNVDFEMPDDKDVVHIEILSRKISKDFAGLDLQVDTPHSDNNKASGTKDRCTWHYSWAAPHSFSFTAINGGTISRGGQRINNGGCCWPGWFNWVSWLGGLNSAGIWNNNNGWDTRVLACPNNGKYRYVVK